MTASKIICIGITFSICLLLAACTNNQTENAPIATPTTQLVPRVAPTISPTSNITPLPDELDLDSSQQMAQALAVNAQRLQNLALDPISSVPYRVEVFGVYPARESDITEESGACLESVCYRVDVFNFATNATYSVLVDIPARQVVGVDALRGSSPELPRHLAEMAMRIATTSPQVIDALGFDPAPDEATMPNVKTALNNTACERSQHLCVAPTFIVDDRALWVIVDLVDERVVGIRWTDLGDFSGGLPTEELIQREDIYERYCREVTELARDGWRMDYMLTASDGLRISDVSFNDQPVLDSAKLVDYHVSYSSQEGFGYSDAIGCPAFSSAAVVAMEPPTIEPIVVEGAEVGFALMQDYWHPLWPQPCNYRYQQRFEFYDDGRFRIAAANLGRGCGADATYRLLFRIQPATGGSGYDFAEWDGASWETWQEEQWRLQDESTRYTPEGFQYRITTPEGNGYYLEPGQGQFGDDGRGDNAFTYVTLHNTDEGDADMVTLGVCCNSNYEQGPEVFIDSPPQEIKESDIVIWYVPQVENDDTPGQQYCWADTAVEEGLIVTKTWPCWSGPMFVPVQ
ncbi:MAG: hypothetical protein JSV68_11845 [Anaerolineaceae bacterium]|nr:MAG: hypothetical protein JSV68_11845 [Anaerolineaceae bacterium]